MKRNGRLRIADVLKYALYCAIRDQQTLLDVYSNAYPTEENIKAVQETHAYLRAFRYLEGKLFKKQPDREGRVRSVSLSRLRNMVEKNEEIPE